MSAKRECDFCKQTILDVDRAYFVIYGFSRMTEFSRTIRLCQTCFGMTSAALDLCADRCDKEAAEATTDTAED